MATKSVMPKPVTYNRDHFNVVCGAARTYYQITRGRLASVEQLIELIDTYSTKPRTTKPIVAAVIQSEEFLNAMEISGIKWRRSDGLTGKQHYGLMIATNPYDKRPLGIRLKEARITWAEWTAWMKNPRFERIIEQFAENALQEHMAQAHNALIAQVDRGDTNAIKFYYELTGRYRPGTQNQQDIASVLMQVVEIISKHVKDPDALAAIADEMQGVVKPEREALPAKGLEGTGFLDGTGLIERTIYDDNVPIDNRDASPEEETRKAPATDMEQKEGLNFGSAMDMVFSLGDTSTDNNRPVAKQVVTPKPDIFNIYSETERKQYGN